MRLLQITDTHLFGDPATRLSGTDTRRSLQLVIDHLAGLDVKPDAVIATGDISQDGSAESYQYFVNQISRLRAPCYWLPGNHDKLAVMNRLPESAAMFPPLLKLGNWQIILLDSTVAGEKYGQLSHSQLARLDEALGMAENLAGVYSLVCLHHNPLPGNADWMSDIDMRSTGEFMDVLKRHPSVRAVVHGHLHQALDIEAHGLHFICTPSTCVQFKAHVQDFALDDLAPGWRWFELHDDGQLETAVQRLENIDLGVDLSAAGY